MILTYDERHALKQIKEFLDKESYNCQKGYFSVGWAGQQLQRLLERDATESKGNG